MLAWLTTLTTFVWFCFLVWYTVRAKWWKVGVGRNTFGVSLVLFLVLLRATLLQWVPDLRQYNVAAYVVFSLALVLGIQRLIYVEKAQRKAK